jgi:hypothetical protein
MLRLLCVFMGLIILSWAMTDVCTKLVSSVYDASAQNSTPQDQVNFKDWYVNQSGQPAVLITTPFSGQQIPVANGNNSLNIEGTSSDNSTTNCNVAIILNAVRPYQNATGIGPGGLDDYSIWKLLVDPSYYLASINEGPNNEIASKITCSDGREIKNKSYSINVTSSGTNESATNTNQSASPESRPAVAENNTAGTGIPPDSIENSLSASLGNLTRSLNNTLNSILRPLG